MAPKLKSKVAKACEAMKVLGYTEEIVKPILRNLLNVYCKNWKHIEDENYSVLLEAILEKEESKEKKFFLFEDDEPEEDEPPLKRSRLHSQKDHSAPAKHDPSSTANTSQLQPPSKQKMPAFTNESDETEDVELKPIVFYQRKHKKQSSSVTSPVSKPTYDTVVLSDDDMEENVIGSADASENGSLVEYDVSDTMPLNVTSPVSKPTYDTVVLSDDDMEENVIGSADASENGALVEYDVSDTMPLNVPSSDNLPGIDVPPDGSKGTEGQAVGNEGNEEGAAKSAQLDVASSPEGEVKISFVCKQYPSSNFRPPSLDAVLKQMEEKYIKSCRVFEPAFLLRMMEDLCECYLIAGTKARAANEPSSGIMSQKLQPEGIRFDSTNHDDLHFASDTRNGSFELSNLIKVLPRVPKFPAAENKDMTCYLVYFNGTKIYGDGKHNGNKVLQLLAPSTTNTSVVVQQKHSSHNLPNSGYYIEDISRGEEKHRISLINDYNSENLPVFKYIPENVIFRNACVKFLLARISDDNCCSNCIGDCLDQDIPCACAGETGGEFAYTSGGLLKDKFLEPRRHDFVYCQDCPLERSKKDSMSGMCKGHLVRKFIKECWHRCGCSRGCGNRVVQRGIAVPLQVFMTADGKGWGLRALEDLPRGAFVCEYVGEIVTNTELYERNKQTADERHTYPVLLDADWSSEGVLKDEEALCLDATSYGNVARFINHRCHDCNLVEIPVEVETPDHHYYHVAFFTTRKVNALEELTWDYGIDFNDHTHPVKVFKCCCGSELCRDIKPLKRARN